ncbi:ABC transporter permease [Thermodesulfobacterium sp. TA1]|uniref:ABC transporter permease n=1 Tax=Thermodesulfobacterium sp. TA1 TaxID=2234087 RepID=UPI001232584C|nr:ABC transporter permease [Thermodesulfobacterium sp. TA1]QER42227.1 ABC transporter permease [Thermodesulfobacterium sp. TA1]
MKTVFSFKRIYGVVLRHFFLLKHSPSRWLDLLYWPTVDLLLWGFITIYLQKEIYSQGFWVFQFIGALIFWNILIRAQQGLAVGFLEDVWSRNLVHIFVSPIRVYEYLAGLMIYSLFKAAIASVIMVFIAGTVFNFKFWLTGLQFFVLVYGLLIFAWSIGLLTMALILFFGQEAEILAWALALFFLPFSAVFYPLEVLPEPIKTFGKLVPASYLFETLREILKTEKWDIGLVLKSYFLNLIYLVVSSLVFVYALRLAKEKGKLPKIGE